jgi:hypothetical protein
MASKKPKKRGPVADRVKIKGDWTDAVKKALRKQRPDTGWPQPKLPKESR